MVVFFFCLRSKWVAHIFIALVDFLLCHLCLQKKFKVKYFPSDSIVMLERCLPVHKDCTDQYKLKDKLKFIGICVLLVYFVYKSILKL